MESLYNFWCVTPEGHDLLFNGRTGSLVSFDTPSEVQKIQASLNGTSDFMREELLRLGFLWSGSNKSEVQSVLGRRIEKPDYRTPLSITISPTYECNFRCKYCYVQFERTKMNSDVESRILRYLEHEIPLHPRTEITWFGGEPLLMWQQVARMSRQITEISDIHKRPVEIFLTTNGYLLSRKVSDCLVASGVRWLHVTIDGCDQGQNTRRVLQDGTGTYRQVFDNFVRTLQDHPNVGGTLRMNLEPDSLCFARPLLKSIPENLRCRIQVHPTPVILEGVFRAEKFYSDIAMVVSDAIDMGFMYYDNDIPVGRQYHCSAECSSSFQIGPDGSMHKCSPTGKPEVTVGMLTEIGEPLLNENNAIWLQQSNVDSECASCKFLCFCMGGCRLDRIRKQHDPNCRNEYIAIDQQIINLWKAKYKTV